MNNNNAGLSLGDRYRDAAEKLIDKYPRAFEHIDLDKVLFLRDEKKKGKQYANTRKVSYPYNFFSEYKFVIIFYENNMTPLTVAQQNMVVLHELLHIGYDFDKLVKHDVQDFSAIVDKYSSNWVNDPDLPDILDNSTIQANDNLGREED